MIQPITFFVEGLPQPAGSKRSWVPINKKTGQPFQRASGGVMVNTVDANPKSKGWQSRVADAARPVRPLIPLTTCLWLTVTFVMPRPKYHYRGKTIDLRPDAPKYHTCKPDATKLLRGVEDALTGIIYKDDSQIARQSVLKIYGDRIGAEITIHELFQ